MNPDFTDNGLTDNGETNVRYDFKKMTKRFGKHYLEYLSVAYAVKDELNDTEFQRLNGGIPDSFMPKIREMALKEKVILL